MKKYRLFIIFTQYQLINAVNFIANTPKCNDHLNDIIVHSGTGAIMPGSYRDSLGELFENVFEINCCHPEATVLQQINAAYPAGVRRFLHRVAVRIVASVLRRLPGSAYLKFSFGPQFDAGRYREVFFYNFPWLVRKIFSALYHRSHLRTLHVLEDGTGNYVNQKTEEYFAQKYKDLQIFSHIYAPELIAYSGHPHGELVPLPRLSGKNPGFLQYLNRLFGYSTDNILNLGIEFVILDQNIQIFFKDKEQRKKLFDFKTGLYQLAAEAFGSRLWLKVHPAGLTDDSMEKSQLKNIITAAGANRCPFELLLLNAEKYPGLITIASTACFTPYYAMDREQTDFRLIVLDRLFDLNKIDDGFLNLDRFIDRLEAKYKFYRPRTREEYRQILQTLSS